MAEAQVEKTPGTELQEGWDERHLPAAEAGTTAVKLSRCGLRRVPRDFLIVSEHDAAYVVGEIQRRRDWAAQMESVAAQVRQDADRLEQYFAGQLEAFTARQIKGTRAKSIKLVTGQGGSEPARLGFRKVKGGLRIVDKEAAIAWARECCSDEEYADYVRERVIESPVADRFKQHFAETGECPGGCEVVEDEEKFFIK